MLVSESKLITVAATAIDDDQNAARPTMMIAPKRMQSPIRANELALNCAARIVGSYQDTTSGGKRRKELLIRGFCSFGRLLRAGCIGCRLACSHLSGARV